MAAGGFQPVCGNIFTGKFGPLRVVVPDDLLEVYEIDDTGERFLFADGQLQDYRIGMQFGAHHIDGSEKVGPDPVEFVDKGDFRNMIFIGLTPYGLRLGFDTADRTEDPDGAIQNA